MKRTLRALALAGILAAVPGAAAAQATLGPTVAYHNDFDFGIGAAVGLPMTGVHENVDFLGDFTIFFPEPEGLDYFEVNANLTYDFPVEGGSVMPFGLAGLNIARVSLDTVVGEASNTEVGLNVGGGIRFDAGTLRPTVGIRLEIEGGDGFVIFGTVPFVLGG